jgi:hypothetical protein
MVNKEYFGDGKKYFIMMHFKRLAVNMMRRKHWNYAIK